MDFEKHKQAGENYLSCDVEKNLCFPMHCNETYEFCIATTGLQTLPCWTEFIVFARGSVW